MTSTLNYGYNDYTPSVVGIKIRNASSTAKCISIIRKYDNYSIAEIKQSIESQKYILSCQSIDTSGIKKIRKCYDELTKNGIEAELYQWDRITTRDVVSNLIDSHQSIALQTQAEIDNESADD